MLCWALIGQVKVASGAHGGHYQHSSIGVNEPIQTGQECNGRVRCEVCELFRAVEGPGELRHRYLLLTIVFLVVVLGKSLFYSHKTAMRMRAVLAATLALFLFTDRPSFGTSVLVYYLYNR